MSFWRQWREDRALRRRAAGYVRELEREPDEADVRWLADHATGGDMDHARWELRYARRALGLIVAERDALDDRTASAVARELQESLARDRHVSAGKLEVARQQLNERLRRYGDALLHRGDGTSGERLGRALVGFSGAAPASFGLVSRSGELLGAYVADANESLRRQFGEAHLPEDVPPSAVR